MSILEPAQLLLIGGLVIGLLFGGIAQATDFCSSGAIIDLMRKRNGNRLGAWGLALAVAILASQMLFAFGMVDLGKSIYLTTPLNLAGPIFGGLLFGIGMMYGHGCVSRNLVRFGSGNLRAFVVVVIVAVTAYATLRGIVAPGRLALEQLTRTNLGALGIPEILSSRLAIDPKFARWGVSIGLAGILAAACFSRPNFRASPRNIFAGVAIGLLIAVSWYFTGVVARDDFNPIPPASLTFVAPVGDAIEYLMIFTGASANFGIALVAGVVLGSFITSIVRGEFGLKGFDDQTDFFEQVGGAIMMGIGGVLAMGCTIGQGLTGMSTLSFGSSLAAVSICIGGFIGERLGRKNANALAAKMAASQGQGLGIRCPT